MGDFVSARHNSAPVYFHSMKTRMFKASKLLAMICGSLLTSGQTNADHFAVYHLYPDGSATMENIRDQFLRNETEVITVPF